MQELVIGVNDRKSFHFLMELLRNLSFNIRVKKEPAKKVLRQSMPVTWGDASIDASDLFGIWKDNPKTLEEIRKESW